MKKPSINDRLTIIETDMKYLKKIVNAVGVIVLGQLGIVGVTALSW